MAGILLGGHRNGTAGGDRPVIYDHTGRPVHFDALPQRVERQDPMAVPHIYTFAGILRGGYRTYLHRIWDEAQRHDREDALAMRRDAFLMGLMQERKLAVCSLKWHLAVDDEYNKEQLRVKDHLTKVVKSIPRLQQLLYYLLDAVWYGRYGAQLAWQWRRIDGRKSLQVRKHTPINGDKIGHDHDGHPYIQIGPVEGGEGDQQIGGNPAVIYTSESRAILLKGSWRERFVVHAHEVDDADYLDPEGAERVHGVGVRDRVFWLDWLRREYLGWLVDFLERVGLGVTLFYYDASNPNSKAEAERAAHEQNRRSVILWPYYPGQEGKGGSVQRVETPTGGAAVLLQLQQHVEDVLQRYVVGQTLSSGTEGSGLGGTGVAQLHAETKARIAAWDANNLAETLTNDLVAVIQRWTFPGADFPVRWQFDLSEPNPEQTLGAVSMAYQLGVAFKTQEVRALTGLSDPEPDDEVIVLPQQDPNAAMGGAGGAGGQPPQGGEDPMAAIEAAMGGGQGDPAFDQLYGGGGGEEGADAAESAKMARLESYRPRRGPVRRYALEGPAIGVRHHGHFMHDTAAGREVSHPLNRQQLIAHAASAAYNAHLVGGPMSGFVGSAPEHPSGYVGGVPDDYTGDSHSVRLTADPTGRVIASRVYVPHGASDWGYHGDHQGHGNTRNAWQKAIEREARRRGPPRLHANVHINPNTEFRALLDAATRAREGGNAHEILALADWLIENGREDLADRIAPLDPAAGRRVPVNAWEHFRSHGGIPGLLAEEIPPEGTTRAR